MSLEVRDATAADAALLARLRSAWDRQRHGSTAEAGSADAGPADAGFADRLAGWMREHPAHRAALALDDGEPVGMAWLAVSDRVPRVDAFDRASGELQSVYVDPRFRSRGVGAALVAHLMALAGELGLAHVGVHSSTEGMPLYRSAGFGSSEKMMRHPAESAR